MFAVSADQSCLGQTYPECPEELRTHCGILERPWLQPPSTLAVTGGYVIGKMDPDCRTEEARNFISAVVAYEAAEEQLNKDPSDLTAMSRVDRAKMDLILGARALRTIAGTLLIRCFHFDAS